MKAEGSQLTLTIVPHSMLSFACAAVCSNRWHMALTFIFLCIQVHFPDVERVEWLNKVRSSELWLVRPPAPTQTLWDKSENVIKLLQSSSVVCIEVRSHFNVGLPLRSTASVSLMDTSWINSTTLYSETKRKCNCLCVYMDTYMCMLLLLF